MRKYLLIFVFIFFFSTLSPAARPVFVLAEEKQTLEQQLWAIEQEIQSYETELKQTKTQKKTLLNKIAELKSRQAKLLLQTKSTQLKIKSAEQQISEAVKELATAEKKLRGTKAEISELIRQIRQADMMSPVKIFFASANLAEFFLNLEQNLVLHNQLTKKLGQEKEMVKEIEDHLTRLTGKRADLKDYLTIQQLEQAEIWQTKKEKEVLLSQTLGKESEYQKIISNQEKKAAEIRNRLYELAAVKAITFGQALKIAEWVTAKIKIRPALLLSVITQESNLGKNVGTCNRPGDPPEKSWKAIMKPERDQEPFLAITKELGINPDTQPVSCPMKDSKGAQIGWGGAMGPAQFIPSTWQGYKERIKSFTGQSLANPWDVRDAFVAAALLLANNGATAQTEQAEWRAAMIYFSGSTNKKFRFYGDAVIERAAQYEEDIENLKKG